MTIHIGYSPHGAMTLGHLSRLMTAKYIRRLPISDSPFGPFKRVGNILQQDAEIATGAGHHSVMNIPGINEYYIVYHRRPAGETARDFRVTCIDRMEFDNEGHIKPVKMTREGVEARPISR